MKKHIFLSGLIILSLSCGKEDDTTPTATQMDTISTAAGMLARNLAYEIENEGWSLPPNDNIMEAIDEMASDNVVIWPTFFRAAADTAMKLEQLHLEALREASLEEML